MRKKRSTVYVRPGKDVTLYIPAETSPAVIDYLNGLKRDGIFSQGVIDIITRHVESMQLDASRQTAAGAGNDGGEDFGFDFDPSGLDDPFDRGYERNVLSQSREESKPDIARLFERAKRNAGKLIDS